MPPIPCSGPPRGVNGDINVDTIDREIVELTRVTERHRATVDLNRQYGWNVQGWEDESSPFLAWGATGH